MKTKIIFACLAFILIPEIGMSRSDKPSLKSSILNHDDLSIIIISKIESEINEPTKLDLDSIPSANNNTPTNKLDITAFIKPEEEVDDDLDFDTKTIFEKLMNEKLESK